MLAASGSSASTPTGGGGSSGASWQARWAVLEPHAKRLEQETNWPGLTDFLMIVAYQESKGVLSISHDGGIGFGPFALHATTGAVQRLGQCDPSASRATRIACGKMVLPLLADPRVAVATAADYAHSITRLSYQYARSDTRWQDVDAGWAIPSWTGNRDAAPFVDSRGNVKLRSSVVARFVQRANELGRPSLPTALALASVEWPGLRAALTILESPHASRVAN
jgi:hypothetical protein